MSQQNRIWNVFGRNVEYCWKKIDKLVEVRVTRSDFWIQSKNGRLNRIHTINVKFHVIE